MGEVSPSKSHIGVLAMNSYMCRKSYIIWLLSQIAVSANAAASVPPVASSMTQ